MLLSTLKIYQHAVTLNAYYFYTGEMLVVEEGMKFGYKKKHHRHPLRFSVFHQGKHSPMVKVAVVFLSV